MISTKQARRAIQDGGIVVYPTDTVFGMGCDPFNQEAVDKLFELKGKKESGLSIMLSNTTAIEEYCVLNDISKKIINEFLPGPITLILKSRKELANGVERNGNLAIRVPANKTALELAENGPVITTSANKHGSEIATSLNEAKEIFGSKCHYLDGEKPKGIESTIIDLTKNEPEIKRIGALYTPILEGIIEF
jgi:L-threonylcarbamoyladenylate synthase